MCRLLVEWHRLVDPLYRAFQHPIGIVWRRLLLRTEWQAGLCHNDFELRYGDARPHGDTSLVSWAEIGATARTQRTIAPVGEITTGTSSRV